MYLVRDKNSKNILHINPAPLQQGLKEKEVYYLYDPVSMEIGKTEGRVPEHFDIDENEMIVELTLEEQVKRKIITLSEGEVIIENQIVKLPKESKVVTINNKKQIVPLTLSEKLTKGLIKINEPFEFIDEAKNVIAQRTIFDVINRDLIKNKEQADQAAKMISMNIESEVSKTFPPSLEMKLIKENMDWLSGGQPQNDKRRTRYLEMQKEIDSIKNKYEPLKKKLMALTFDKKHE